MRYKIGDTVRIKQDNEYPGNNSYETAWFKSWNGTIGKVLEVDTKFSYYFLELGEGKAVQYFKESEVE